jgi:hypothetical protein
MLQRRFGRGFVLGEVPDALEARQHGHEPALGSFRHGVGPELFGHLQGISFGHRQALGGLKIKAPLPETSHLLFEALPQALTSAGRNADSRLR